MKLRMKIQLFSSLFMLILILFINTAVYFLFDKISTTSELEKLVNQTNTVVETLQVNSDIPKRDLLSASLGANSMIRVFEEDTAEPILIVTKETEYRHLSGRFSDSESHSIKRSEDGTKVAIVSKPIIWDDGKIVTLEYTEYLISLQSTMKTLFYVLFIASLLMLIPTIIGGSVLSRFLLQPIKLLTETMKENTQQGKWKKINLENRSHDELYEMEKTFNDMIEQLKETFEKQEVFVSDASHELKTPISIVKSYAQLLKRQGKDHPEIFDESTEAINSEANRMQNIVEQLLLLAKSKQEATFNRLDLGKLCEKVVTIYKGAYSRNFQLHIENQPIYVDGDVHQLEQLLYILIDNAYKYSNDEVKINVYNDSKEAIVEITDFGQGISEEDKKYIFDRFYRVDKARSRDTGGTGLGLAIAKAIVDTHKGKLFVSSKEGIGSTFTFKLSILKKD